MTMTLEQLKSKLGAVESGSSIYEGISAAEIPLLKQLLNNSELRMIVRALFSLARIRDGRAISVLGEAANDTRPEVRVAVAAASRFLNPRDSNPLLMPLLQDQDAGVRKFAIQSVTCASNIGVHNILRNLGAGDPLAMIREGARRKLHELGC